MADPENTDQAPKDDTSAPSLSPEDNPETDKAVEEILRNEGDEELRAQDTIASQAVVMKLSRCGRFKEFQSEWWHNPRKKWTTISILLVVIASVFAVPMSRYEVIGLFVREKVTVEAVDSKTGDPVSGAQVKLGTVEADTDAKGKAILAIHAGSRQLVVSKKYYAGSTQMVLVTLSATQNTYKAKLRALGRQVKVQVDNAITGKPVAGAEVSASGAAAKTDDSGIANVVLPSGANTQSATVSLSGYNNAAVTITAGGSLSKNTFTVTPAGKLYFLSNLSGTIDVVKTNLDGTDRQTVLAGTGNEDPNSTSLLASRDWKYLALLSKRSGSSASIYLIDTTNNDKLTTIDQGNATFSLVGWSGDQFVYEVDRSSTIQNWQANQQALKSFDPTSGNILLLAQTQSSGTSDTDYARQVFGNVYLLSSHIVFTKNWSTNYNNSGQIHSKQAELDTIDADGTNSRVIRSFGVQSNDVSPYDISIDTRPYEPNGLYVAFDDSSGENFYSYENGTLSATSNVSQDTFFNTQYPTHLLSPSDANTFWAQQRDGKNTLFTGDANGDNQKQVAALSDYSPYGWYTDNYLLVSKNSSELYIMPTSGGTPLKITDYYKPPINYNGYGGGYGGL